MKQILLQSLLHVLDEVFLFHPPDTLQRLSTVSCIQSSLGAFLPILVSFYMFVMGTVLSQATKKCMDLILNIIILHRVLTTLSKYKQLFLCCYKILTQCKLTNCC